MKESVRRVLWELCVEIAGAEVPSQGTHLPLS